MSDIKRQSLALIPALCLAVSSAPTLGATPAVELLAPDQPVSLSVPWKYQIGDDLTWAQPEYDDSAWTEIQIPMGIDQQGKAPGFAWFRLEVQVGSPGQQGTEWRDDERSDLDLGLTLGRIHSAYEVYAGGIHLGGVGALPPTPKIDYDRHGVYAVPARAVDAKGRLLLALRVWSSPEMVTESAGPHHGPFYLGRHAELTRRELLSELPELFLTGLYILLGLYHLELWRRRPKMTSYAWFCVTALSFAGYSLLRTQWKYLLEVDFLVMKELEHLLFYLMLALFIQLLWPLINLRIGPALRVVQATAVMLGLLVGLTPGLRLNLLLLPICQIGILAVCVITIWTVFRQAWRAHPEARVIVVGVIIFSLTVFHDTAVNRDFLDSRPLVVFGFAAIIMSLAVSLSNKFLRTYVELDELRHDLEQRGEELARQLAARQRLEDERERLLSEMDTNRALHSRIETLDRFAAEDEGGELARAARSLVRQDQLYAKLLRAESPAHLAALRDELREIEEDAREAAAGTPLPQSDFLAELRLIFEGLESLEQLPSNEDKTLALGQALTRAMTMQEQQGPGQTTLGGLALDAMREVFVTALGDLSHSASMELELRSKRVTAHRETMVVLEIRNAGKGPASDVAVELTAKTSALRVQRPRRHLKSLLGGQSARLEFPVEPRESDRVRLAFHVTWDDLDRRGKELDFADVMEVRRFRAPDVFRPLRPNPYVVGRPLLDSDFFFGREELFAQLTAGFQGAEQDNIVALIGQRRMGKTSILRRLHLYLPAKYVPVIVDLQGIFGEGESAFFAELAGQITDGLEERGIQIVEPVAEAFASNPGDFFRRNFLKGLTGVGGALDGRRLLLVFDELEVLEERIRNGELTPRILPYLRGLMQHEKQISFMLAGTHRLDELTASYWGVLFNLAIYIHVGHLSETDISNLLKEPTRSSFEIDSLALEKVYRTTGGHPHFSQLLARELVELSNRNKLSYVTVQDVNRVIDVVADKGQLHIAYLWDEASRDERLLMLATKNLLEREGLASTRTVHRYLSERRVPLDDLSAAVHRLGRRQILREEGGRLSFRIDLLRRWLGHRHDLESFFLSEQAETEVFVENHAKS